jgi:MazG family protein
MSATEQSVSWEDIKAREREAKDADGEAPIALSHLHGVPQALPALMRAFKLSKRAARVGFDWDRAEQTADKVAEELAEVREAARNHGGTSQQVFEEVGDLLFAAANLARKLGVDAEAALRAANAKFERRFRGMEALAAARGETFASLDLAAQERLWLAVKNNE